VADNGASLRQHLGQLGDFTACKSHAQLESVGEAGSPVRTMQFGHGFLNVCATVGHGMKLG